MSSVAPVPSITTPSVARSVVVSLLLLLLAVLVVVAIAVVAAGHGDGLPDVTPDHNGAILPEREMRRTDVDELHLSLAVRGYRTDEVDDVLDRLALEIEERDQRIAELEARLRGDPSDAGDVRTLDTGTETYAEPHAETYAEPSPVTEDETDLPESAPEHSLHEAGDSQHVSEHAVAEQGEDR